MSQPEYLIRYKAWGGGNRFIVKQEAPQRFRFPEIVREVPGKSLDLGPLGKLRHVEGTGKVDKGKVAIFCHGTDYTLTLTPENLKSRIRRLRDQERAELDRIDAELSALRERRKEVVQQAWVRGHTVTVKEMTEKAEEGTP